MRAAPAAHASPAYRRALKGSLIAAVEPEVRKLLQLDAKMPATVIAERIGWEHPITTLKDRVRQHLSLTHGGLANPEEEGSGDPGTEGPGIEEPGIEEPGTDEPDLPGADSGADDDASGLSGDLAATGGHDYTPWFAVGFIVIGLGITTVIAGWRRRADVG